jgi:hypothetical protein
MTTDTRRFRSTDELMNAVFGSVPLTDEQRRLREAEHRAAQELPPPPQEVRPPGWLPPGYVTTNTDSLAFRNGFALPEIVSRMKSRSGPLLRSPNSPCKNGSR